MSIPTTRHIVAVHGDGQLRRIEQPVPALVPGTVLIRVRASLVSPGSELRGGWRALRAMQETPDPTVDPRPIGYSVSGEVIALGEHVDGLSPGDRVAAIGAGVAQHANVVVVPHNLVVPLPAGLKHEEGAYAMLLATGMQAARRGGVELGHFTATAGLGIVGLLTARIAQLAGAYAIGWDMIPNRLQAAEALGLDAVVRAGAEDVIAKTLAFTGGLGLDVGFLAVGGQADRAFDDMQASMKRSPDSHHEGVIVVVGGAQFPYKGTLTNTDIRRSSRTGPGYHDKDWERGGGYPPVFMRWTTRTHLELCLRLVAEGKIDVTRITSHRVPFEDVEAQTQEITRDPDAILGMVFQMADEYQPNI